MASAYYESPRRPAADEGDDFDEYDPTPYGGGYDLFVTFGRPLPPSEETCYPCSEPSTSYDVPHYSASEPSPYGHHTKAKPNYGFRPQQEQQPSYGSSGGGYGSRPEPAAEEGGGYGSGYGSGYGREKQEEESYGSGYGRKPQAEETYGSGGYGSQARPEAGYGSAAYGSGYGSNPQAESYGSGYGRKPQVEESYGSEYGSGYGRNPQVEQSYGSEYGSGYVRKPQAEEGYGSGYGSRPQGGEEYGSAGYGRKTQEESYGSSGYGYGRKTEEEGYGGSAYGYEKPKPKPYGEEHQSGGYERPSYGGGDEYHGSYGRKKHVSPFPFELGCVDIYSSTLVTLLCLYTCYKLYNVMKVQEKTRQLCVVLGLTVDDLLR
jgi:hypothetical protein